MGIYDEDEAVDVAAVEAAIEAPAETAAPADEAPAEVVAEVEPVTAGVEEPKPPHGFVPHAALHAERQRVAELRARDAQRESRLQALEAMIRERAAAPAPVEAAPAVDDDPLAVLARVEGGLQTLTQQRAADLAAQQAEREVQQIQAYVAADVERFKAAVPDFDAAATHLVQSRVNELRRLGYGDAEIADDINAYDAHISRTAATAGISAAEMMYDLARERGYRPPAPTAPVGNVTPIAPAATAKVDAIAKGQASERSIGSAPGSAPAGSLDLRAILDLPDDEFAKISEAQFRKLAGG